MSNIVAIVGRPNVGKSTFFNRLIGKRQSIVDDFSGVTRDRQYGACDWGGKQFTVVDTGGFVQNSDDIFEAAIRSQVRIAAEEAALILFMVDVTTGITDLDEQVADMLRRSKKPIILIVNKVDNPQRLIDANEFWAMGFPDTLFLSSVSGSGSGEILDEVIKYIEVEEIEDLGIPKISIVGQPNAGKSSFLNALVGEERAIVTDIAGTTRDTTHTRYNKFGKDFILIDTAGIRKKAKVHEDLEFYSVMRAIKALEESDICMLMIDATQGIQQQDLAIFSLAKERHKGLIILINKWDLIEDKDSNTSKEWEERLRQRLAPFNDVPIIFMSVLEKQRIMKAIECAEQVHINRTRKITTSQLNEWLQASMDHLQPSSVKGRFAKIKYITQLHLAYPAFTLFVNNPNYVNESYRQYLENRLRKAWNFQGVPIAMFYREK
jgi:GTPase